MPTAARSPRQRLHPARVQAAARDVQLCRLYEAGDAASGQVRAGFYALATALRGAILAGAPLAEHRAAGRRALGVLL